MKMNKICCSLLLSVFGLSGLCSGMEYDENAKVFISSQKFYNLEDKPECLGTGKSALVYKTNYKGKEVAVKVFKLFQKKNSQHEVKICGKIYDYSQKNNLNRNLVKVIDVTKAIHNDPDFGLDERAAIVFEIIDGVTLTKWLETNKFESLNSYIDDFCIPLINAFKEYYEITGELKPEILGENIMMRKNSEGKWEPVLIDYGPGAPNPIGWLYDTLSNHCPWIKEDERSMELREFISNNRPFGESNITAVYDLLTKIKEIRNC